MRRVAALVCALAVAIEPAAADAAYATLNYGSTSPSYGWRAIAGPTEVPMNKDATNLQMMSRTPEFATDAVTQIKVVFSNFLVASAAAPDSGASASPGNAATVTASIEYPAGTCTQLQFSGSGSGSIPNGGQITSDALTVSIPNGATFWVREFTTTPSGATPFGSNAAADAAHYDTADGEKVIAAASGLTDYTGLCAAPGSWAGTDYGYARKPLAVIGWTQHPAVCLIGDSRTRGYGDVTVAPYVPSNHFGQFDRWIGPAFGTINLGTNADRGKETSVNDGHFTNRGAMLQYCTHAVYAYGINDFNNVPNNTAAMEEGYFQAFRTLYDPSHALFWYLATTYPYAGSCPGAGPAFQDSSGSGGYTPAQKEAARQAYNTDIRAGSIAGQDGLIDIDAVVAESPWPGWTGGPFGAYATCFANPTDTGLSKNLTTDGLHLWAAGTYWVANAFNNASGAFAGVRKPKLLFCADKTGAYRC